MKKNLFVCLSFLIFSNSCSSGREDAVVTPQEKKVYNFQYSNSYKTYDLVLFKGPNAIKENPKEEFIQKFWGTYTKPQYNSVQVDLENNFIKLDIGSNFIKHQIELSNDSIYISEKKIFIAILDRKKENLELFKSFYYIQKNVPNQEGLSYTKSTKLGKTKFEDVFFKNSFNTLSEMTNENDEVFWANLSFKYK